MTRISRNRLGGNALWLDGDDGNSYYYAHFDRYGKIGAGEAGDIVGYVGDTGDARGTPHLHFEVHPGRGPAVNPYPTARSALLMDATRPDELAAWLATRLQKLLGVERIVDLRQLSGGASRDTWSFTAISNQGGAELVDLATTAPGRRA